VAGQVKRLHDVLRVIGIGGVVPAGKLEIDLTVRVGRVVAPGEQAEHDMGVEIVHDTVEVEPVGAAAEAAAGLHFRGLPLAVAVGDAQMEPTLVIDPDVVRAGGEEVWALSQQARRWSRGVSGRTGPGCSALTGFKSSRRS
jgi:hypothetical protein